MLAATFEEDEPPEPPTPDPTEQEDPPERSGAFLAGPSGIIPVPEGMSPQEAIARHFGSRNPSPQIPRTTPTKWHGPSSDHYHMKVVNCAEEMNPENDPEVKDLLQDGWEPFGVHRVRMAGTMGVRMYFRMPCGGHG